ncbi:MAG: GerMN domain-containing protein [Spirochaetaceae bacterium]|jgi:hypothetical protein|nr:GerMN domain-containing protein [Spirochaetaceae bacterium]
MIAPFRAARAAFRVFLGSARLRRGMLIAALFVFALAECLFSGKTRETFVFFAPEGGAGMVEERMLRRPPSGEMAIRRYVEETLLGPSAPGREPLFPPETRLSALILRDGVVYVDLSLDAALPVRAGRDSRISLRVLDEGIRRNFRRVRDVRLFIEGSRARYETPGGKKNNSA